MLDHLTTIVQALIVNSASTKCLMVDQIVCGSLDRRWLAKRLEKNDEPVQICEPFFSSRWLKSRSYASSIYYAHTVSQYAFAVLNMSPDG